MPSQRLEELKGCVLELEALVLQALKFETTEGSRCDNPADKVEQAQHGRPKPIR